MRVFALCGSLRLGSSNRALLELCRKILPGNWDVFELATLPYFEPEKQFAETPAIVEDMRRRAGSADFVFIVTPEYAHGIPGVLKNGLEWLFCEATMKMRTRVVIGSGQGEHTRDQLLEILSTMDFTLTPSDILLVKGARTKVAADGAALDPALEQTLREFLLRPL